MKLYKLGANVILLLRKYGVQIQHDHALLPKEVLKEKKAFIEQARKIYSRHFEQSQETVRALSEKYEKAVWGKVHISSLFELLGQCIDPSDPNLFCVSQLVHSLQVVEGMENDGITDQDLILAGLIHDLGKILLLKGEAPENVLCMNTPIGKFEKGIGLDNCIFQWNHDEFLYSRLRDYLPDSIAWLIRYHGIYLPACESLMNDRDREYSNRYLSIFQKYDKGTKSIYRFPKKQIEDYRDLIQKYFPKPILF